MTRKQVLTYAMLGGLAYLLWNRSRTAAPAQVSGFDYTAFSWPEYSQTAVGFNPGRLIAYGPLLERIGT